MGVEVLDRQWFFFSGQVPASKRQRKLKFKEKDSVKV